MLSRCCRRGFPSNSNQVGVQPQPGPPPAWGTLTNALSTQQGLQQPRSTQHTVDAPKCRTAYFLHQLVPRSHPPPIACFPEAVSFSDCSVTAVALSLPCRAVPRISPEDGRGNHSPTCGSAPLLAHRALQEMMDGGHPAHGCS